MMEVQQPQPFQWANDAYAAFSAAEHQESKWTTLDNSSASMDPSVAFTIPPALLTNSTARFGQITPPEERSPADSCREVRQGSIPVEELLNESLWPSNGQDYLQSPPQSIQQLQSPPEEVASSPKRRRTSKQSASTQAQGAVALQQEGKDASENPQPPKRKRGRPKSQPQMVEAYTADGYPFQVSSARQCHLEKNRVAAHKCRQRKKEYIGSLEGRAREFSAKNKALKENVALLREEVLSLKNEVLRHAGCNFWAVDEYLARCAGDLLGKDAIPTSRTNSMQHLQTLPRENSQESLTTVASMSPTSDADDFGGLDLLRTYEDELNAQQ